MTRNKLKILSVCTSDTYGGAARAAYRIHKGVRELGVDSCMFVKEKHSSDDYVLDLKSIVPDNVFYKAFDWTRNKIKNKLQHYRWNRYPDREKIYMSDLRATDLHGALRKLDFDVLHLHWINQRFISIESLPCDKPIVWTLHDSWPFCGICHYFLECEKYKYQCGNCLFLHSGKANDLSRQVWKKKASFYKRLDLHIVSPSQWLADCAKESSLLGRFPVTVIPNCLDTNVFRPVKKDEISSRWLYLYQISQTKPLLLYGAVNATNDRIKGFEYLLSALQIIEQQGHGYDFELVVFGADESELGIDVNIPIHYVGYISNMEELVSLYNLASVMVVPSMTEVFGQTASEALACETPVVAFKCTGIQEVVDHRINGYLAQPYSSKDLANGILWCFKNNVNNQLGKAGRENVLKRYTSEVICKQYKALYEEVIKQ